MNYLYNTNKYTQALLYILGGLAALLLMAGLYIYTPTGRAHAEPAATGTVDLVLNYCRSKGLPKAICTETNAERARNVATYHVDDSKKAIDSGKTADEILAKAKAYVAQAKSKNLKTSSQFVSFLKTKGGSLNTPKASTKEAASSTCTGACGKATKDPALDCTKDPDATKCDLVKKYVNPIISVLTALVGVAVTIGIIMGALRYVSAGDDSQKVAAARKQIRGALVALLAFIFLYAALKWLLPSL
jgi:hypothetical protein